MFTITAKVRDPKTSLSFLRKNGEVPAVFYGLDKATTSITISEKEFSKIWKEAGESSTITLETGSGKIDTLIHDVQVDPVTSRPVHADFFVIDASKPIEVTVPIEFIGVSPAVKGGVGTLVKVLHEFEVKALPKDMPHAIIVDISSLDSLQSQILASQVELPTGVTLITKEHEVVVAIATMKEE